MNAERETQVIQNIVRHGIEREELRDEIIVQCMRQVRVFSMFYSVKVFSFNLI